MTALLTVLLLAQSAAEVLDGDRPFEAMGTSDGARVSRRAVAGSPFFAWRVERDTTFPTEALCTAVFEWGSKEADAPGLLVNRVLVDGDDERVTYSQMSQPIVANRDYALRLKRERFPDGGCRIRFETANELAPPSPKGAVRIEKLFGEWLMTPLPSGGATLRYTLFSDPAGSVPAFLVHGPARTSTVESFHRALEKTKARQEAKR